MRVRTVDAENDWLFGKGRNDYSQDNKAVAQLIQTRLQSFLGDCFFASNEGLDWWNLLGSKNQIALNLAITSVILNTPNVIRLRQLSVSLDEQRNFTVQYEVNTAFTGVVVSVADEFSYLVTQDGDFLSTDDGDQIIT